MSWPGELRRRIHMLLQRERVASELAEEMEMHLELRRREQIEAGVAPKNAGAAAKRRFGNATLQRERSYIAWGWGWLESLLHDIAYGLRAMRRSPGVTLIALLSLALGIGANSAIFSLMDAVMLRSLPVKQPEQLVLLGKGQWMGISDGVGITELYSYPFYRQFQKKNQVFSDTAAMFSLPNDVHGSISSHRQQEPMHVQLVSGTYFGLLGVHAINGRVLTDEDDRTEGGSPVAVVSYAWWTRDLGRDPEILNRTLKIGETRYTIVGVTPPEFFGTKVGESPDIWIPFAMVKQVPPNFDIYKGDFAQSLYILGRLKLGVTVAQATTNANLVYQQILRSFLGVPLSQQNEEALKKASIVLTPMAKGLSMVRAEFSDPLKILMGIVGLVLLIACANIANLLLARATVRGVRPCGRQGAAAHGVRGAGDGATRCLPEPAHAALHGRHHAVHCVAIWHAAGIPSDAARTDTIAERWPGWLRHTFQGAACQGLDRFASGLLAGAGSCVGALSAQSSKSVARRSGLQQGARAPPTTGRKLRGIQGGRPAPARSLSADRAEGEGAPGG
jgi:hypothetical protein